MPTLVATPGASNANSYVSLAEFAVYLDERLNAPDPDETARIRSLLMATRRVDDEEYRGRPRYPMNGQSTGTTQALQWPRTGAAPDGGWTFDHETIPEIVKRATMELAIRILEDDTAGVDFLADPGTQLSGLEQYESIKVDVITIKPRLRQKGSILPDAVVDILRPVLLSSRGRIALERG